MHGEDDLYMSGFPDLSVFFPLPKKKSCLRMFVLSKIWRMAIMMSGLLDVRVSQSGEWVAESWKGQWFSHPGECVTLSWKGKSASHLGECVSMSWR